MSYQIQAEREIADLRACLAAGLSLRAEVGELGGRVIAQVSGWSVEQHLYHVALATDMALRNVQLLLSGRGGRRVVQQGGPNELAVLVLTEGRYPRGESETLRMVRPPDEVVGEYLSDEMERNRVVVLELQAACDGVHEAPGRVLHPMLGELNAAEWLRFARLHARHHLAILIDLQHSLQAGGPSQAPPA